MGKMYAVMEIQKIHSLNSLKGQERHNNREYPMRHVDENMSYLNREIVSTGGVSYAERWKEIVAEREYKCGHPITVRKNAVYALDIVTAFSPGAAEALNIDINQWCELNRKWMCDTFGEDNILAMTLHMDETDQLNGASGHISIRGPHIHTQIVPLDDRDRLCARSFTGSKTMMKKLHNSYGKAMSELGLSRGEPNSKMRHYDRKRWYNHVSGVVNTKAPRINDGETMEEYLSRLDNTFQDVVIAADKEIDRYRRKWQHSETRQAQIFGEYSYAINLQHLLEESYGGDMTRVNERLKNYQLLEKAVPRKNLSVMIDKMLEKYPPENSIAFWRRGKKKRHAKWESLPDSTTTATSTDTTPIFLTPFEEEEKEVPMEQEQQPEEPVFGGGDLLGNALGEELTD